MRREVRPSLRAGGNRRAFKAKGAAPARQFTVPKSRGAQPAELPNATLPPEWQETELREVCEKPQYGFTASAQQEPIGPKFVRITDLRESTIDWVAVPFCEIDGVDAARYLLRHGDVLVARIGATTGGTSIVLNPPRSVFASYLIRLRATSDLDSFFLYFYTKTKQFRQWIDTHKDSNIKGGVNIPTLLSVLLALPPMAEQKKIAAVLWKLRRAIATQDRIIAVTRDLRRSVMRLLFTRGLRGESLKETAIGRVPESWTVQTILDLCEIWSGGTPRKSVHGYWNGDIPWVSGKDLKTPSLDDAIDHISAEGLAAGSRLAPEGAVLLLVRGMGLAKDLPIAVINRPMAFNQDVKALIPRSQLSGQFLRSAIYASKERLLSKIVRSAHGTMTLNLNDVETLQIACPSDPGEATEMATIIWTINDKLDHHQRKRAALDDLFHAVLHHLMSGRTLVTDFEIDMSELAMPTPELVT